MLADLGLQPLPAGVIRDFIGQGIARLVERCLAQAGPPLACARMRQLLALHGIGQ